VTIPDRAAVGHDCRNQREADEFEPMGIVVGGCHAQFTF